MKVWANIEIPLKTYTVHLDHDLCSYVTEMKQRIELGWKKQQGTSIPLEEGALDIYDTCYKEKLTFIVCSN
ncbi:hypothetical protein NST74_07315 [Paenibacillus sp. FSL F4-0125]|uniref:hypothetical protein n=1 Tax=Paenibacillus sp. FSL F4-0125 TaxID=2954730 RepID=UPI0030F64C85